MLTYLRNFLVKKPLIFSLLRKMIELNFVKEKKLIKNTFNVRSGKKILDIGCGPGEFAKLFNNLDYYGVDISEIYVNYAAKKNKGSFQVMNSTDLKFPDNSFDYILIMAILHHLDDPAMNKTLSEAKRVLKPGGTLLIMEDAKVVELENLVVKFFQKFDHGDFIRTPDEYKKAVLNFFNISQESTFGSGGCTYCGFVLIK